MYHFQEYFLTLKWVLNFGDNSDELFFLFVVVVEFLLIDLYVFVYLIFPKYFYKAVFLVHY